MPHSCSSWLNFTPSSRPLVTVIPLHVWLSRVCAHGLCGCHLCVDRLQVPFEEAVSSVHSQLVGIATGRTTVGTTDAALRRNRDMFGRAVSFAAAVLTPDATSALLRAIDNLSRSNKKVAEFWTMENRNMAWKRAGVQGETEGNEGSRAKEHNRRKDAPSAEVKKPSAHLHVTLAHKRSHGAAQVASYARFVGSTVRIQAKELLFNENCAAVAVEVTGQVLARERDDGEQVDSATSAQGAIRGMNAFPHITVSEVGPLMC